MILLVFDGRSFGHCFVSISQACRQIYQWRETSARRNSVAGALLRHRCARILEIGISDAKYRSFLVGHGGFVLWRIELRETSRIW